eukprot:m.100078 g.100078  ORF g.100078 m.100078 type:complete len:55 (+) comp8919_c0_seq1:1867-2031(+)
MLSLAERVHSGTADHSRTLHTSQAGASAGRHHCTAQYQAGNALHKGDTGTQCIT